MNFRQKSVFLVCMAIFGLGIMSPTIKGSPVPALVGVPIAVVALGVFIATVASARSGKNRERSK
ncbi:hypothetical protein GCM10010452_36720 [Crossiella cryophila]